MVQRRINATSNLLNSLRTSTGHGWARCPIRKYSPVSDPAKDFYVTTPIFYVNSVPHVGHLHSMVIADVLARYHSLRTGKPSFMVTGTDEHGMKIQRAASDQGLAPQALCESVSARFRDLAKSANINYSDFIRTTESRHHLAARKFWTSLSEKGYIYKGKYQGWYSVSDETYFSSNQVETRCDPVTRIETMIASETGQPVEWIEEDNYMFKLSLFRERLIEWLTESPNALISSQRSAILNQLHSGDLNDLSVSRPASRLSWGVPVPTDNQHVMYVWLDALTNYLTVTGYPWKSIDQSFRWPADIHVVGKDIVRFHAIYWPAMLMAAGLPLPRCVIAHGHWTMKQEKMSKSRGNVADPFEVLSEWGIDSVRYYLMRGPGALWGDTDWALHRLHEHYRKDLAGQLGNLLARISSPILWNRLPPGRRSGTGLFYPPEMSDDCSETTKELIDMLRRLPDLVNSLMEVIEIPKALKAIFDVLGTANRLIQETAPWHDSTGSEDAYRCLYLCAESLRLTGILLQPFIPDKASELLENLGVPLDRRKWGDLQLGSALGCCLRSNANNLFPKRATPS